MSNERTRARHQEVELIRTEARQAARTGKSVHSCPYKYMDAIQWTEAFRSELEFMERQAAEVKADELHANLRNALADCLPVHAIEAIIDYIDAVCNKEGL